MIDEKPHSLQALLDSITPEIHANLKRAVELGRWENGERLTQEQRELCLQAVIAYDEKHLPPEQRVAFIDTKKLKKKDQ